MRRAADGLRGAAAPLRALGLQRLRRTRSRRSVWERAYPTRYESLEIGYPRNDVLATADRRATCSASARELGIEPGQTAVLYAPTHREYQRRTTTPRSTSRASPRRSAPTTSCWRACTTSTTRDPLLRELHRAGRIRDVAAHPSVEELCLAADVLVTDYSSIMFDYAVLDRPIVIHAPDWEVYRALRGTYFDLMAEAAGPGRAHRGRAARRAAVG